LESNDVNIFATPLPQMFNKIIEHSNLFYLTKTYLNDLMINNDNTLISNVKQSEIWKMKISKNPDKSVISLFL